MDHNPLNGMWTQAVEEIKWNIQFKTDKAYLWENFCYYIFDRNKKLFGESNYYKTPTMNPSMHKLEDIITWTQMQQRQELHRLPPMPEEILSLIHI